MDLYEKELQKFFQNFMSAMLQAEIGGGELDWGVRLKVNSSIPSIP